MAPTYNCHTTAGIIAKPYPSRVMYPESKAALQRIAAGVEYGGSHYCGWQCQRDADTVQARLEAAIGAVAAHGVRITAAGRTDAGVHAIGQVIHFDTTAQRSAQQWLRGVNTHLPGDISLLWTQPVAADFHARFSARARRYRYVILNRDASASYLHRRVAWYGAPLSVARMRVAATVLTGCHDFSAFRAAGCQAKSARKTMHHLRIEQSGDWIWLDLTADGFLRHMVRNIVGSLVRIGEGRCAVDWLGQLLAGRDRRLAAATAAPDGLYFAGVEYDSSFNLPPPPPPCRFW